VKVEDARNQLLKGENWEHSSQNRKHNEHNILLDFNFGSTFNLVFALVNGILFEKMKDLPRHKVDLF